MYKIYCDSYLIYNTYSIDALKLGSPKLELEVNKTGTLSFTIYPQHPYFEMLKKLKSIITVYQNKDIIFRGRILNDETGFKNEKQVTCEGELAFLLDSTIRPYEFKGDVPELFAKIINEHNAQVDEVKRFKVGNVTVTDPNGYINRSDTQYMSAYDNIFKKLVEPLGGYINFRHEADGVYIDYLSDFSKLNPQNIELRKNILDIKSITKGEDIATAIIPLGAKLNNGNDDSTSEETQSEGEKKNGEETSEIEKEKRLTIESVNGGKDYIFDADAVKRFGWIFKVVTWDDVTEPTNLLRKGSEELANSFSFAKSLEISAVDLSGVNSKIAAFRIGTYNKVISDVHGLNELLLVTKLSLTLDNPKSDKLTLGVSFKSFTDSDKDKNDNISDIIDNIDKIIADKKEIYKGTTPPTDTKYIWLDTSLTPPLFKRWNGTEWAVINDTTDEIKSLREELQTSIQQTSEAIRSEVSENYYLKDETDSLVSSISTALEQTKNEFKFSFDKFNQDLEDLENGTNSEFEKISKYIRFVDGDIVLGEVGNELILQIKHNRISFIQNNAEVAYFSDRKLFVTDGEYTNSLTIGNFAFIPRANGNVSFKKVR